MARRHREPEGMSRSARITESVLNVVVVILFVGGATVVVADRPILWVTGAAVVLLFSALIVRDCAVKIRRNR